jgi:hypothetical protein
MTDETGNTGAEEGTAGQDAEAVKSNGAGNSFSLLDEAANPDAAGKPAEGVKPEWLTAEAWDEEKKAPKPDVLMTELERAQKRATDLLGKLSKGQQKPPATAEAYKLPQLTDEADAPVAAILKADDPLVKGLTDVAHKIGMSQVQYETFMAEAAKLVHGMAGTKEAPEEITPEQREEARKAEYAKIGPNAPRLVAEVSSHIKMMQTQGLLSESQVDYIKAFAGDAEGVKILNIFRSAMGGEAIPMNTDSVGLDGLPPDAEIAAVIGGKEYMAGDPATHRKVENWLNQRRSAGRPERLAF